MKKLVIEEVEGVYHLEGRIDDKADLSPLLAATPPLQLNLANVFSVNTVGIRKWIDVLKKWGARPVALWACPPPFVSVLNSVPQALGLDENPESVKSVLVPYSCEGCNHYQEFEVQIESLKRDEHGIHLPDGLCESCGGEPRLVTDPEDYFLFYTWGK